MRGIGPLSKKFKNRADYQLALDMRRTRLVEPINSPIAPAYSGLSLISFKSLSHFSRASGVDRVSAGDIDPEKQEPFRVLLVDDEKDITIIFKSSLERAGFIVEVFNNPLEALSHFKPDYYDLVLLDVRMPQMSGFELYQQISKQDKGIKTCFITAFEVYREELLKYSIDKDQECIIRKPISTRELVKIIRQELGQVS